MKEKILLADDEERLLEAVKEILEHNDYDVDVVVNGEQAIEQAIKNNYNVIVLDIMMPIIDGIEAIKIIREKGIETPIILVTAKSEVDDKVKGLDAGANDYLTKPFNQKELLARVRALTRQNRNQKYEIGNLTFDVENSKISTENASLFLNNKECDIMKMFVNNKNRTFSEDEIKNKMGVFENNAVPMYISFLQEKFDALGADLKINNENGYGLII